MSRGGALVARHFGPDTSTVGGMATVIRVFAEHAVGADVVHAHPTWRPGPQSANLRLLARATVRVAGMPSAEVAHVHLSEGGSFVREGALVALAHARGLRSVVTLHGADFMPFAREHPRLVRAVLRRAHAIACLDEEALEFVHRNAPGVRVELIPNPIFVGEQARPADATEELVVFAGEIGLRKGADVMCEAWRIVSERRPLARCVMVGPPGDFEPVGAERLEVRAAVGPREMDELLLAARVVALPSRAERMPMVLTECMSLARPFVSTPVGGIPELAREGGLLVPVDDASALAERLIELLAEPALARDIGDRGRAFCLRTRSVEVVGARFRELYAAADAARGRTG